MLYLRNMVFPKNFLNIFFIIWLSLNLMHTQAPFIKYFLQVYPQLRECQAYNCYITLLIQKIEKCKSRKETCSHNPPEIEIHRLFCPLRKWQKRSVLSLLLLSYIFSYCFHTENRQISCYLPVFKYQTKLQKLLSWWILTKWNNVMIEKITSKGDIFLKTIGDSLLLILYGLPSLFPTGLICNEMILISFFLAFLWFCEIFSLAKVALKISRILYSNHQIRLLN